MRGIELSATRPIRLHSSVKKRQCSVRQCVSERSPSPSLAANSAPTQSKGTICTSVTRRTSAGRPCQSSTISMSPASGIDSPSKSHDQARLQVPRFTPARMSVISDSESASESPNPPTRTYPLGRCMSCSAKSVTSSSTLFPIYFGILSIASIGIGISRGDCRRLMGCCRMSKNGRWPSYARRTRAGSISLRVRPSLAMRARWLDEPTYELRCSFTALSLRRVAAADPSAFWVTVDVQHHPDPVLLESESLPREGLS
ncbi:hypothetical protein R69608_01825 [Paraburkholderia nemoris]|nr:hypothetical protein R69608_01825 [Paraburkholderia nemoris]